MQRRAKAVDGVVEWLAGFHRQLDPMQLHHLMQRIAGDDAWQRAFSAQPCILCLHLVGAAGKGEIGDRREFERRGVGSDSHHIVHIDLLLAVRVERELLHFIA